MKIAEKMNVKKAIDDILSLPRAMQAEKIEAHSKDEGFLKEFAAVLVPLAEDKGYKAGALKQYSKLPALNAKGTNAAAFKAIPGSA